MMYSAYELNKPDDITQPCCTTFPVWNQLVVPCLVLTADSWPAYRFLRRQVRWSSIPIFQNFPQFAVIHTVEGFHAVSEVEVDVIFLESLCFFYDSMNVGNLISGSSAFSKSSLCIWKFSVHVLVNPSLKGFEHNLTCMWLEQNCTVDWTFFGTVLLWDWNENWYFPVLWSLLSFPNLLAYWNAALSQHHLLGLEIAQLEFHHFH